MLKRRAASLLAAFVFAVTALFAGTAPASAVVWNCSTGYSSVVGTVSLGRHADLPRERAVPEHLHPGLLLQGWELGLII